MKRFDRLLLLGERRAEYLPAGAAVRLFSATSDVATRDATATADGIGTPVDWATSALESIHATTGLPWWATVVIGTVSLRVTLFPLIYYQAHQAKKLTHTQEDMKRLSAAYTDAIRNAPANQRFEKAKIYWRGFRAIYRKHDCNPIGAFVPALVQIPCFVTFVLAWRGLIREDDSLKDGGALWFTDLTVPDETYALPAITLSLAYFSLQLAASKTSNTPGKFVPWLLDSFSVMLIGVAPFVVMLPQGVFVYWMTSSSWGIAQTLALRNPGIRSFLRIPSPMKTASKGTGS
eukprot:g3406.t1